MPRRPNFSNHAAALTRAEESKKKHRQPRTRCARNLDQPWSSQHLPLVGATDHRLALEHHPHAEMSPPVTAQIPNLVPPSRRPGGPGFADVSAVAAVSPRRLHCDSATVLPRSPCRPNRFSASFPKLRSRYGATEQLSNIKTWRCVALIVVGHCRRLTSPSTKERCQNKTGPHATDCGPE